MRVRLAILVLPVVALCVGCSESTGGQATGAPSTAPPSSTLPTVPPTSSSADSGMKGKTEFSQEELCEVLTGDEAQQLGGSEQGDPGMNVTNEAPLCQWTDATSLVVGFRPNAVVAGLESGPTIKKSKIEINGIPAVLSDNRKLGGLCQVGIDLTDHSDLVVGVSVLSAGEGKYDKCDVAKQMATIIFSKVK
jgi:hypothetical protein